MSDDPKPPPRRGADSEITVDGSTSAAREPGKRLFVGIRLAVGTANALGAAAATVARRAQGGSLDLRWVAPVNYHLTLRFLGWTREASIPAVQDALVAAARGTPRMTLKVARLGAFPSLDQASVLWAGVEEGGALAALAHRLELAMVGIGYAAEPRTFHPHVTIARLRETRPIRDLVLPVTEQMFGDTRVDAISLIESETKSSGSVYRDVARIGFESVISGAERQTRAVHQDPADDTDDGWPRGQGPNAAS